MFNITDIFMLFALVTTFFNIICAFMLERKERLMNAVIADYEQRLKNLDVQTPLNECRTDLRAFSRIKSSNV